VLLELLYEILFSATVRGKVLSQGMHATAPKTAEQTTWTLSLRISPLKSSAISNVYSPLLLGRDSIRFRLILKSSNGLRSLQSAPAWGDKVNLLRAATSHVLCPARTAAERDGLPTMPDEKN